LHIERNLVARGCELELRRVNEAGLLCHARIEVFGEGLPC
jgi:hypothetical protein